MRGLFKRKDEKKNEEDPDVDLIRHDVSQKPSIWNHLTEDQILEIRDKSKLPLSVRGELTGIPHLPPKFTELRHYNRRFIRKYFATYGEASGLKPGVCWPSASELEFRKKFEETFYPTINEMLVRKKKEKEEKEKYEREAREKILLNLKKLPQIKKEFMEKFNEKLLEESQEAAKKEKQIQEVREFLGYDVAMGDTRFQEALVKMEEEKKAVAKASKKQEKQAKILATLAALVQTEVDKAAGAPVTDTSPSGPSSGSTSASNVDQDKNSSRKKSSGKPQQESSNIAKDESSAGGKEDS